MRQSYHHYTSCDAVTANEKYSLSKSTYISDYTPTTDKVMPWQLNMNIETAIIQVVTMVTANEKYSLLKSTYISDYTQIMNTDKEMSWQLNMNIETELLQLSYSAFIL